MRTSVVVAAALAGGCLSNPATGVGSTGGPMRVKFESGTGQYVSNDVVSEDAIVDSNGNETGMAVQHRADVTHTYQWSQWNYFQGRTRLDEQDFYRLAGDHEAEEAVRAKRTKAERMEKLGIPIAIAGYIGEALLISYGKQHNDDVTENVGIYGGTLVGSIGALMYTWGLYTLRNPHLLPMERAADSADLVQTCREGRCRTTRGGRGERKLGVNADELRQLHVPFQRTSLGMR